MSPPRRLPSLAPTRAAAALCGLGLVLAAALSPAHAQAQSYTLDPVHTRVMFAIEHAGFSKAIGTVSGSEGRLDFDPDDWRSARLQASIPIARIDLGDADWNRATLARNLLDAERYPTATFVSTRIDPVDDTHANVVGTLTLRGVSREVTLATTFNVLKRHPLPPFRRTVGFSATTTLSRSDFGITAWPSVIGDQVELRIELEATRTRAGTQPADAAPTDDATDPAEAAPRSADPAPSTPTSTTPDRERDP
jgi:polyisoprenoid-binding protein YceI